MPGRPSRKRSRRRPLWPWWNLRKLETWHPWPAQDLRKLRISKAIRKALALKHRKKPWNSECHAKQIKTDQDIMTHHDSSWLIMTHHDSWLTAVTRNFHKSDLIQNLTDQFIPGDLAASHLSGEAGLQRPCAGKLSTDVSSVSTSWAIFETNSMEFMPWLDVITWCTM